MNTASGGAASSVSGPACKPTDQAPSQLLAAYGASGGYLAARSAYLTATRSRDTTEASGKIIIRSAQATVISNQNADDVNRTNRPSDIAAQQAAVAQQVSLVAVAQHNLDNTILYAPVGGNVSTITGAVGEYLPGSVATDTALAPGTDAAIPGVGAAATSDQSGNASSGISATRPGGGAFIVLNNINSYQVVVPFEESDAAKVAPNQKVQVTFDAIPDLQLPGTVLSIAPNGRPTRQQFTPGATGDDNTQVLGGLSEGQQILLPRASAGGPGGATRGGAGGGGTDRCSSHTRWPVPLTRG